MARIEQCKAWNHAKQTRLVSNIPSYQYQILYEITECKGHTETRKEDGSLEINPCRQAHKQWRGEYGDGTTTQFFIIETHDFRAWEKRKETDPARPECQTVSEYTEQMCKSPETFSRYLKRLDNAKKWFQGKRVEI